MNHNWNKEIYALGGTIPSAIVATAIAAAGPDAENWGALQMWSSLMLIVLLALIATCYAAKYLPKSIFLVMGLLGTGVLIFWGIRIISQE